MTAGGASDGGCSLSVQNTIEVFSPPYLFRGPRPEITAVPASVRHGERFLIRTGLAGGDVDKVVMVRPMAVTHQTDSEQRVIPLKFHRIGKDRLQVLAPDGVAPHAVSPRGYYLVFVVNSRGVPSEAKFVRLM